MAGYYGTDAQKRLQALAETRADFIRDTAGACQAGRTMGCDDIGRFGWDRIEAYLESDGVCGFRLIPAGEVGMLRERLERRGCRLDTWDVFLADSATALAAADAILSGPLPDGLIEMDAPADAEGEYTQRIQAFMAATGVVPFSGSLLTGAAGPATTLVVGDREGDLAAVAHGYLPHNASSRYSGHAWGGLVAVDERMRGKGLGSYINARMVASVFRDLGATHIYELVSATNIPSRRMVHACGVRLDPGLVCGVATPAGADKLTR